MAKKPQPSAAQAVIAAATAPAEQQGNLPAGPTSTDASAAVAVAPGSTDAAGSIEQTTQAPGADAAPTAVGPAASTTGQDAHLVVIWGGLGVTAYLEALKAGGLDVIQLKDLAEPLLRQVGQFVEIEGYDALPPEQLIPLIEAKAGIEPQPVTGSDTPVIDAAAAAVLAVAADDTMDDDGDIEGLWIRAVPEQGFRRLGMRFTREGHAVALSALTDDQVETLFLDPNLIVESGVFSGLVG